MTFDDTKRISTKLCHGDTWGVFSDGQCVTCGAPEKGGIFSDDYPPNWDDIARGVKDHAGWKCERCGHEHDFESGHVLTVHHLDGRKSNCVKWNLAALCQRCHLRIQGRVKMDQLFFADILDVSPWFKPHLEGYLQSLNVEGA